MANGEADKGGGVSGFGLAEEEVKPLGGSGGAAGGGTRAGAGEPSGEGIGGDEHAAEQKVRGGGTDREAADEAAALGDLDDHDETPALEYGEGDRPRGPTMGEAIGSGAGTDVGSGTPADHSGIGGGGGLKR